MASPMASKCNARMVFSKKSRMKEENYGIKPKAVSFPSKNLITLRQERLLVKASAGTQKNVGKINGKKINGIHTQDQHLGKSTMLEKGSNDDTPMDPHLLGRFVEGRFVYRQNFMIRSYEVGPDRTATMETLMNLLQDTALNHVTCSGLAGDGFGATHQMSLRKLIWVVTRINIQVQKYSSWGDVIEIDTWVDAVGKNGMRRDWIIRDCCTQEIITRATSTWVIMNRETRRLAKIPDEVKQELEPFYINKTAISYADRDVNKIDKLADETAERIRSGLAPRWSDMDANQHVNNVKYIGWIMECIPMNILGGFDLTSMTLEFRRECRQSSLLESLASTTSPKAMQSDNETHLKTKNPDLEYIHLLRMQSDKAEIVRARSEWKCKEKPLNMNIS